MTGLQRKHLKEELQKFLIESIDEDQYLYEAVLPEEIIRTKEWLIVEASYDDIISIAYFGSEPVSESDIELVEGLYELGVLPYPVVVTEAKKDPIKAVKAEIKAIKQVLKNEGEKFAKKKKKTVGDRIKYMWFKIKQWGKIAGKYLKMAGLYMKKKMKSGYDWAKIGRAHV